MPDSNPTKEDETWELNVATKPRRRRDAKGMVKRGGRPTPNKKSAFGGTSSFGNWAKPLTPKAAPQEKHIDSETKSNAILEKVGDSDAVPTSTSTENDTAGFMMQTLSSLLADYGEFDPNWMDKEPEMIEAKEEIVSDEKAQVRDTSSLATTNRLGQKGKAPVHIDIISFGFRHGAPSTRRDGWSQTQPLQPFDCREILPAVPGYLQFHDGLSSGQVKRFLLYDFRRQAHRRRTDALDKDEVTDDTPSVREYSAKTVAPQIYEALIEAVRTGGFGYALPLKMQMFVGSEWGRHRSVVAVEQTASALRKLLRNCKDDSVLECPCSVATQHRDIDRRMPSKKNRDDDDY